MAVKILYECKVCGGNLVEKSPGMAKCESCRREQSIPLEADSEKINRANRLRMKNKNFDDALKLYERIIEESPDEAEAYWGVVLCRYGIEFVEDKKTGTYIPTCHRTIDGSISEDVDFIEACNKANDEVKQYYLEQAKYIDDVQKKIHQIVANEKPYDVFISYKATDDEGNPTPDSKEALKIYHKLDNKGFKVFFAEETLKRHAGEEYEPYIYAALKTSKIMILIGSKTEYFEAPWVKNEWARFLDMMSSGNEHKKLLPFYFDMDAYELPVEISGAEALNWRDAEAMSLMLENVETFLGYKSEKKAVDAKDIDAIIASREKEKAVKALNNAVVLARSGHKEQAKSQIDELIKANPNFADAYWQRMLLKYDANDKTITSIRVDLSKDPDYIQAVNNASGDKKKFYLNVAEECRANCALQSDYNAKFNALKKKYKQLDDPEVSQLGAKLNELLNKKIFEEVYCRTSAFVFVLLAAISIMWIKFTGGSINDILPEYEGTIGVVIVVVAIVIVLLAWYLSGSLIAGAIIGAIICAILGALIEAMAPFIFVGVVIGAVVAAVILVIKIVKSINNKKAVKEFEETYTNFNNAVDNFIAQFEGEYNSLTDDYLDRAYKAETALTTGNTMEIYDMMTEYRRSFDSRRHMQQIGARDVGEMREIEEEMRKDPKNAKKNARKKVKELRKNKKQNKQPNGQEQ